VIQAVLPVAVAAAISTALYAVFMFALRLSDAPLWSKRDDKRRWLFVLTLMLGRLVPSIMLFFIVLSITIGAEHQGVSVLWASWLAAHLINNAVVIIPFMLLLLLRVRNAELEFLRAGNVSLADRVQVSLFERFWRDLLVVYIFVFVLIWNGDAANQAMSTVFRSVNAEMVTKLVGRNSGVARVLELLAPTIALAAMAVGALASSSHGKRQGRLSRSRNEGIKAISVGG
jgi:hypothetical protein